jgi:hypothetical protein
MPSSSTLSSDFGKLGYIVKSVKCCLSGNLITEGNNIDFWLHFTELNGHLYRGRQDILESSDTTCTSYI